MAGNNPPLGYYGEWKKCDGIDDPFENTKLYIILESFFAKISHAHSEYASSTHNHDTAYSPIGHNHNNDYSPLGHNHDTAYSPIGHNHNNDYSPLGHNHDTAYSLIGHNHDSSYSPIGHTHSGYASSTHNHNTWTDAGLNNSYLTLYVNEELKMCELRMSYYVGVTGGASGYAANGLIPSTYKPSSVVTGAVTLGGGVLYVNTNGDVVWKSSTTVGTTNTVYGSIMWHY